jgi:sugar lactone lactonase YvrE
MLDRARVRAPELDGAGGWIGAGPLTLAQLRGKVVLLDFWTLACVNCQRVVEELRGLERRFADALVVIGVHSPKFPHEHDHGAVRAAVARHRIEHPVLDDPAMTTWDAYAVKAWPTLVLVDADGRVALTVSGEGHAVTLASAIEALIAEAEAKGTLRRGPVAAADDEDAALAVAGTGELAFPGKVAIEDGSTRAPRIAIADTGHDRVLVGTLNGEIEHELNGFYQPQGVRFDGVGDTASLLVCETGADRVWRVWLDGRPRELITDALKSPWDVVVWREHVVIAEAGRHRLWAVDRAGELQVLAGTGAEGLVDGPGLEAQLAQPSALAITADGDLAFLDAEASALRVLRQDSLLVETLAGTGLFAWGDEDGDGGAGGRARLQHPLGLALGPAGELYVADTFNDLLRVWRGSHLWTVPVRGFAEPGGVAALPDGRLLVADTDHHRIVRVDPLRARTQTLDVGRPGSSDAPEGQPAAIAGTLVEPAGSTVTLQLDLDPGDDALDPAGGPPVRVRATASEEGLLREPTAWTAAALPVSIDVALGEGSGRITLELLAATCGGGWDRVCRLRRTQRAYDVLLT